MGIKKILNKYLKKKNNKKLTKGCKLDFTKYDDENQRIHKFYKMVINKFYK